MLSDAETITIPMKDIKLVRSISIEALIIIDQNTYYYIKTHKPRAPSTYVAGWRFLTGKDYI